MQCVLVIPQAFTANVLHHASMVERNAYIYLVIRNHVHKMSLAISPFIGICAAKTQHAPFSVHVALQQL